MTSTPATSTIRPVREHLLVASGILSILGALGLLVVALTHPRGVAVDTVLAFEAWALVHLIAAGGAVLLCASLVLRLLAGAHNTIAAAALSVLVVATALLALALALDGGANPALASYVDAGGDPEVREFVMEMERPITALAFGFFGLAAAVLTASHWNRAGLVLRAISIPVIVAFLMISGSGFLYIGAGVEQLGFLFMGGPIAYAWIAAMGLRLVIQGRSPAASQARAGFTPAR